MKWDDEYHGMEKMHIRTLSIHYSQKGMRLVTSVGSRTFSWELAVNEGRRLFIRIRVLVAACGIFAQLESVRGQLSGAHFGDIPRYPEF